MNVAEGMKTVKSTVTKVLLLVSVIIFAKILLLVLTAVFTSIFNITGVLVDRGGGLCFWIGVTADGEHGKNCVWICEREYHLSPH